MTSSSGYLKIGRGSGWLCSAILVWLLLAGGAHSQCPNIAVAAGDQHSLLLRSDGTVWASGLNIKGQVGSTLGLGSFTATPVAVDDRDLADQVLAIAAGDKCSFALRADGTVWAWGYGQAGRLGTGSDADTNIPARVAGLTDIVALADGGAGSSGHALALRRDGSVWAWGAGANGQLGNGTQPTYVNTPVRVDSSAMGTSIRKVSIRSGASFAVTNAGDVWVWGSYDRVLRVQPFRISALTNIVDLTCGSGHCLALEATGTVFSFGSNGGAELGRGVCTGSLDDVPQVVGGLPQVAIIGAGGGTSFAVDAGGSLWAWGDDDGGQADYGGAAGLGDQSGCANPPYAHRFPTRVTGVTAPLQVVGGRFYSLALTSRGEPWATGANDVGQHGDGTITWSLLFEPSADYLRDLPDTDDDGVDDGCDGCPDVADPAQTDTDADGAGDVCDLDDDGDGVDDDIDNCSLIVNAGQEDGDGDGVGDPCDNCTAAANPDQADTDANGIGDACQSDDDGDGVDDPADNCPLVLNPLQEDVDGDGVGDACDICPADSDPLQDDLDADELGDACDPDDDGDGVDDGVDNCPEVPNAMQADRDGDGLGDDCDPDDDADLVDDPVDNCPLTNNPGQEDLDGDGLGDACDADSDGDAVDDAADNCASVANPDQVDTDGDGIGNACDADDDNDLIDDPIDNCPFVSNPAQEDADGDGVGDACDGTSGPDADGDGVLDVDDNCIAMTNPDQDDLDSDGVGDVCDIDIDGDGIANTDDNCPSRVNPSQEDTDGDGLGNLCDQDADGDGVTGPGDNCPLVANPGQEDLDGDGVGDACDADIDADSHLNGDDCAPTNPGDSNAPDEVLNLRVSKGSAEEALLSWTALGENMTDVADAKYGVIRGGITPLWTDRGCARACGALALAADAWTDPSTIAPGVRGHYYLVQAMNDCGVGSPGRSVGGAVDARAGLAFTALVACP